MEEKNAALVNEAQTLLEYCNTIAGLCYRLTADKAEVNEATIRSMYTMSGALSAEANNFARLLDGYFNEQ